jgi:hypothetical protein
MKMLKLTAAQLGDSEILSRKQLKNVLGGNAGMSPMLATTTTTSFIVGGQSCGSCQVGNSVFSCVNSEQHNGRCWCNADGLSC